MSGGGGGSGAHAACEWLAEANDAVGCMGNSTKQYAGPASVDSVVLQLQLFLFASVS
jgi:hypothetical protein